MPAKPDRTVTVHVQEDLLLHQHLEQRIGSDVAVGKPRSRHDDLPEFPQAFMPGGVVIGVYRVVHLDDPLVLSWNIRRLSRQRQRHSPQEYIKTMRYKRVSHAKDGAPGLTQMTP